MALKAVVCIIFMSFIRLTDGNNVTLLPNGTAYVMLGDSLTLECIYSGTSSPFTFNFYLNPDTVGLQIRKSTCGILISTGYNTSLYSHSCNTSSVSLKILMISQSDYGQTWECDVSFITADPLPPKDSTVIQAITTTTVLSTSAPSSKNPCKQDPTLAYGLGLGLGNDILCIIIIIVIIIVILANMCDHLLAVLFGFIVIGVGCIVCIVVLLVPDDKCSHKPLKLGLGLGLGLVVTFVICVIFIVILIVCKKVVIQNKDTLQRSIQDGKEVTVTAIIYGFWISEVEWIRGQDKLTSNGDYDIVTHDSKKRKSSLIIKRFCMTNSDTYICRVKSRFGFSADHSITFPHDNKQNKSGPPLIHTGTQNKVESETDYVLSKSFDQKERRPLPPLSMEPKDKSSHRPQPPLPENSEIKDTKIRGISANFDDTKGLANDTPRTSRLPPLQPPVQSTIQEEVMPEKTKKKKKKNKKEQMND